MDHGKVNQSLRGHFQYSTIPYVYSVYKGDLLIKLEYTYIKESCLIYEDKYLI